MRKKKDIVAEALFLLVCGALFFALAWTSQDGHYAPCGEYCPFEEAR